METINPLKKSPIGIFDSGLGGLTVLKSLEKLLPNESFIYFGDTAHVPYGSKSAETVIRYSKSIMDFFMKHYTKAVVIACNTASAVAYDYLKKMYTIPLFDVVTPSVEYSIKISKSKNVGVIGTYSTIKSKAYTKMFKKLGRDYKVKEVPCPLFVPLIEEGWVDTSIAKNIVETYLNEFQHDNIQSLILGCTHYPIMANTIQSVLSNKIELIHSGKTVGNKLKDFLIKQNIENSINSEPSVKFYVTDFPQKFDELESRFLGRHLKNVSHINSV